METALQKVYPDERVFDVQLATSDTEYLSLLEKLKRENSKLQLIAKRLEKCSEKSSSALDKQADKVQRIHKRMDEYKAKHKEPRALKAFVTFSSIEAANYIKRFNSSCCSSKQKTIQ